MIRHSFEMENVFLRTGRVGFEREFAVKPGVVSSPYGLVLYWPKVYSFIKARAVRIAPTGQSEFRDGANAVDDLYESLELTSNRLHESVMESHLFLSTLLERDDNLRLEITVDTDDESFIRYVKESRKEDREATIKFSINAHAVDRAKSEGGEIEISANPCVIPEPYRGYVGLDLGNTNSTLAVMPFGFNNVDDIKVLEYNSERGKLLAKSDPVISQVWIESLRKEDEDAYLYKLREAADSASQADFKRKLENLRCHIDYARWGIGKDSRGRANNEGLVLGAKRLLARRSEKDQERVYAYKKHNPSPRDTKGVIRLPNSLPAELFICRMMQAFTEASLRRPEDLAATYPTTYSSRELHQLKDAIAKAWLRMRVTSQSPEKLEEAKNRIGLMLDEASAAAFFFLYRRVFNMPGGLRRFRYMHPDGLNLLIYDCGGGTTDIALVRAESPRDLPSNLRITVKARGGLRDFGGDNITREAFRVLKAKIALALAKNLLQSKWMQAGQGQVVDFPPPPQMLMPPGQALADYGQKLKSFIQKYYDGFDAIVPTRFHREVFDEVNAKRRARALTLWEWAEKIKQLLENGEKAEFLVPYDKNPIVQHLQEQLGSQANKLPSVLSRIIIHRAEIDSLIHDPLDRSLTNCNRLIRQKLGDGRPDKKAEEEIHWVVAAGNASRYPLVSEVLKSTLHVRYCEDRFGERGELDRENLKLAVAKGALLALVTHKEAGNIKIEFDSQLYNRLPFDVSYYDYDVADDRPLFYEHESFDDMQPKILNVNSAQEEDSEGGPAGNRTITLRRRWPGDDEFRPFLGFHFERPVQGAVTISYNRLIHEFEAVDSIGQVGDPEEITDATIDMYRSPAQSGEL